jgi:hypothetical protein
MDQQDSDRTYGIDDIEDFFRGQVEHRRYDFKGYLHDHIGDRHREGYPFQVCMSLDIKIRPDDAKICRMTKIKALQFLSPDSKFVSRVCKHPITYSNS